MYMGWRQFTTVVSGPSTLETVLDFNLDFATDHPIPHESVSKLQFSQLRNNIFLK